MPEQLTASAKHLNGQRRRVSSALCPALAQVAPSLPRLNAEKYFRGRLTPQINEALIAAGLDSPERLLFMTKAEVKAIHGIGAKGLAIISAYRSRYPVMIWAEDTLRAAVPKSSCSTQGQVLAGDTMTRSP